MAEIWFDVDAGLAEVPVNIQPLIDDTDFKSREVEVAYNAAGMDLVWNFITTAGAYTQTAVTPTTGGNYDWAHVGDGMYSIEIPASGGASINNDTEGFGWFTGIATGVLPWRGPVCGFRAAALNNALIDGGDYLETDIIQVGGDTQSGTDLKDFVDAGYDPSTNHIEGVKLATATTSVTNRVTANVTAISGDETAADNAESFFDGTGYAGTNNVIPSVTTVTTTTSVTNQVTADVTAISGDTTAANNAESFFDGTGYAGTNNVIPTVTTLTNAPGDSTGVTSILTAVTHADYGLDKLVRSTTPANTLDVSATGEAGLDFANIKAATGATTLTNITVPTVTAVTNRVTANVDQINGDGTSLTDLKDFVDAGYDPSTHKVAGVVLTDTCTTNSDMRGTDGALLATNVPTNFTDLAITASTGRVTVGTNADKAGYSISGTKQTLDALNDITVANILAGTVADLAAETDIDNGATITITKVLRALFNRMFREVTQSATTQIVKNDAGDTIATMNCSEADGVQTKGAC